MHHCSSKFLTEFSCLSFIGQKFLDDNGVNWWHTPPESPDINPIENLWHEIKEFIRREIKPKTKDELVNGILWFWDATAN